MKRTTLKLGGLRKLWRVTLAGMLLTSSIPAGALLLPQDEAVREITGQMAELAAADVSPAVKKQFNLLIDSRGSVSYPRRVMESFFLLKDFRNFFYSSSWDVQQRLALTRFKADPVTSEEEFAYDELISSGNFPEEVLKLRPLVANYPLYRNHIAQLLLQKQDLPRYRFTVLRSGSRRSEVRILKEALIKLQYLPEDDSPDNFFDETLTEAVTKFQKDSHIKDDGVVGKITYDHLYSSGEDKAVSLARNLLRLSVPELHSRDPFILVNLPQAQLFVYEDGKEALTSLVIAGSVSHKTPLLKSRINNVVFNPPWNVPSSIKHSEYLPHLEQDPFYLAKRGLHLVDHNNRQVTPQELVENYSPEEVSDLRIVQKPGAANALGLYKFDFPNPFSVYLHSTSNMSKFRTSYRYLSHGCVRVEKSRELAVHLLRATKWNEEEIGKIIKNGKTRRVKLDDEMPVFIAYITSYVNADGEDVFFIDPYRYDFHKKFSREESLSIAREANNASEITPDESEHSKEDDLQK